jgi:hypothetical protein
MKFPKVTVHDKPAFEKRLQLWILMRDCLGDGKWENLADILDIKKYTHGSKRTRKKRLRKYITQLVIHDTFREGRCERLHDGARWG